MLKALLRCIATFCLLTAFSSMAQPNSCRISGKITGFKPSDGEIKVDAVVIGKPVSFTTKPAATGQFELSINQPAPTVYNFTLTGRSGMEPFMFFCDPGDMVINLTQSKPGEKPTITAKGGISQEQWNSYNKLVGASDREMKTVAAKWEELAAAGKLSGKEDSLRDLYALASGLREQYIRQFLAAHPDSFVSPFIIAIQYLSNGTSEVLDPLYQPLTQRVKDSYYGKAVGDQVKMLSATALGSIAPNFSQTDPDGKVISLESLRGKYVLVDFWASWCGPCRQENPNLVRTYDKFRGKMAILGVSLDQKREPWLKAIQDDGLSWLHVSDLKGWSNEVAVQYGVHSIPANYLVDPSGKIIAKGLRGADLDSKLEELIR